MSTAKVVGVSLCTWSHLGGWKFMEICHRQLPFGHGKNTSLYQFIPPFHGNFEGLPHKKRVAFCFQDLKKGPLSGPAIFCQHVAMFRGFRNPVVAMCRVKIIHHNKWIITIVESKLPLLRLPRSTHTHVMQPNELRTCLGLQCQQGVCSDIQPNNMPPS